MTRQQNPREKRPGRRAVLKSIGAAATAGLVSTPGIVSAKPTKVALDPSDAEPSAWRMQSAPEVKRLTSNYPLLTLPQESVFYYLDNSEKSPEEKQTARENFIDLKRTFPLRKETDGNLTTYKLAPKARDHAKKEDVKKFEQVGSVFADGATGFASGPSIQQHPSLHKTMTQSACIDMGLSYDVEYTTKEYADDPDNPTVDLGVPDSISHWTNVDEGIESFISDVIHHVGQYYNPDPGWSYSYLCDHNSTYHDESSAVGGIGGAPTATDYHFNKADNTSGETQEQWVGRLTHFPEDMGQPLHTGMAWQQGNVDIKYDAYSGFYVTVNPMYWLHYGYEDYVKDYWDGDWYAFHENFDSNNCSANYCYYETNGDGYNLVYQLADFTHQYSETVYNTILAENGERDPSNWYYSTHEDLRGLTQDCMHQTGLWVRGCLDRYFG